MSDSWWRDLLRLRCCAVVSVVASGDAESADTITITICKRWRFHRGECR